MDCSQIECDVMGFGFVLEGSSPSYVQTVDPLGPAAAAGLQVGPALVPQRDLPRCSYHHRTITKDDNS